MKTRSSVPDIVNILLDGVLNIVRKDGRDLSLRQLAILLLCYSTTSPQTVRGLAHQLMIHNPAVTRAVDRLEGLGLIARQPDPSDGRSTHVTITAAGRHFCEGFASGP